MPLGLAWNCRFRLHKADASFAGGFLQAVLLRIHGLGENTDRSLQTERRYTGSCQSRLFEETEMKEPEKEFKVRFYKKEFPEMPWKIVDKAEQ